MRILRKEGDDILVVASSNEQLRIGDYLIARENNRGLVLQIYDERYLDVDGIEEEIAREEVFSNSIDGIVEDPLNISSISRVIRDMRVFACKARGTIENKKLVQRADWVPSRTSAIVSKLSITELIEASRLNGKRMIAIGRIDSGSKFSIPAEGLDGRITVITGKKESGKSHLAKILLRGLLEYGAYCIVFDLNDEYGSVGLRADGSKTSIASKIKVMRPGKDMKFRLSSIGLRSITSLLLHSLDMPGTSLREFVKIWELIESRGEVTLNALEQAIQQWRCNEFVRDALYSRYHTIASCGLFTDSQSSNFDLHSLFLNHPDGLALILSLSTISPLNRRMVVELVLSKLVELLEQRKIPPTFLLAEEAHLYLRDTYWEDLITRMRHFGVFTIFVTNQPDAIEARIYRQVDNIFLYNFSNESDLSLVSQASMVDSDTVRAIVRSLPKRICLLIGSMVNNLPILVNVDPFDSPATGTTRRFFDEAEVVEREISANV